MENFGFSENEFSDEDEDEFYFFEPISQLNKENEEDKKKKESNNLVIISDFNKIKANKCELNKQYLKEFLQSLFDLTLRIRKNRKTDEKETKVINQEANEREKESEPKSNSAENRHFKKIQEAVFKKIEASLFKEFKKSSNPFYLNLFLIENSNDYRTNKFTSLACLIGKAFDKWIALPENSISIHNEVLVTEDLKIDAFITATRHNILLLDSLTRAYELNKNNDVLIPYVKAKILKNDHKDKAIIIGTLCLHDHFKCEEILLPLLFQDKLNIIDKYLINSTKHQKNFVEILDRMCDKNSSISSFIYDNEIKNIKLDKLNRKNLSKLAIRMIKMYSIDSSSCPNITNQKYFKNLKYLVFRRYVEKSITYEPWQELVIECLNQAEYLKENFIDMLSDHEDCREICVWINKLNLDIEKFPIYIQHKVQDYKRKENVEKIEMELIENDPIAQKFYKLKLNESEIKIINKKEEFHLFLDKLESLSQDHDYLYVGVDTEWKPTCVMGINIEQAKRVALFQVATKESIFLIDLTELSTQLDENDSHLMAHKFLNNKKIIKLGYGFTHDIKMLSHSFINMHDLETFRLTVIDLAYIAEQLKKLNLPLFSKFEIQEEEGEDALKSEKGLSELVRVCLGKPLNKSEQISNWEKRPLRKSQIQYAALDAYCLVEIFEFLKERVKELKIDFDFIGCIGKKYKHSVSNSKKEKSSNQDKNLESKSLTAQTDYIINETPIEVKDLRIVCDNMLGGLGRELRRLGVDTVILENESDHSEVAKIARRENRYAISSGIPFISIRNQLPEGRCIHAINGNAKEQCSHILKIFNVKVTVNDFFSRCFHCNTGFFIELNKNQIKLLWLKYNGKDEKLDFHNIENDEDLLNKVDIDEMCLKTPTKPKIDLNRLFESTINMMDAYFICGGCGQIYWEGPHWQNKESRFSYALKINQ